MRLINYIEPKHIEEDREKWNPNSLVSGLRN